MCDVSEFIRSRYMIGSTFKVELYVPTDSCTAAGQLIIHDAMLRRGDLENDLPGLAYAIRILQH